MVYNLGALWLVNIVLRDEEKENEVPAEKKVEELVRNMERYRNVQRRRMVKAQMQECQGMVKGEGLGLVKVVERVRGEVLGLDGGREMVGVLVGVVGTVVRQFEGKITTGGNKVKEGEDVVIAEEDEEEEKEEEN